MSPLDEAFGRRVGGFNNSHVLGDMRQSVEVQQAQLKRGQVRRRIEERELNKQLEI
ncbi:hypothetical protein [Shewanella algae]